MDKSRFILKVPVTIRVSCVVCGKTVPVEIPTVSSKETLTLLGTFLQSLPKRAAHSLAREGWRYSELAEQVTCPDCIAKEPKHIRTVPFLMSHKLKAIEFKYYQHQPWEPKKGDYYCLTRDGLETFRIANMVPEKITIAIPEGGSSVFSREMFFGDFHHCRVFIPPHIWTPTEEV